VSFFFNSQMELYRRSHCKAMLGLAAHVLQFVGN
jgi:hypothetical protein